MIPLAALAIYSGLSLNLLLSFALGTAEVAGDKVPKGQAKKEIPLLQLVFLFGAVLFLWIFFNWILPPFWKNFSEYFLFFPLSALMCMGLELLRERIVPRVIPGLGSMRKVFSAYTAYDGLVPASLIITFSLAWNFTSAFVLTLFFVFGILISILVLNEIRRKSTLERTPRFLRGSPLILVSMGLLSLVSAGAAVLFFKILEVF